MTDAALVPLVARPISGLPWPVWGFVLSLFVPADLWFEIAGIRLDAQRIVLIAASGWIVWWAASAGLRLFDLIVIAGAGWGLAASFVALPAAAALERGGAFFLETAIAFLLPAAVLTTVGEVRGAVRLFVPVVGLLSFAAGIEAFAHSHFIAHGAAALMERAEPFTADTRLGLLRARATFSHQILFGLFCAGLFALFWYEARSGLERTGRTLACAAGTFFSLSSAAWVLFVVQALLIAIEHATRRLPHRLSLTATACVGLAIAIEVAVEGGLAGFVTRYLALNPETAYYRQLIWTHVTDDIAANPIWGTGGSWTRLSWMVESIDQTYFAKSIRYGIPAIALMVAGGLAVAAALLLRPSGGAHRALAIGWAVSALALALAGLTVDYFGRSLPFVMFLLGTGAALARIGRAR